MSRFVDDIRRLVATLNTSPVVFQDCQEALNDAIESASQASTAQKNEALFQLAGLTPQLNLTIAALVALACGAIVEQSGDPTIAVDAILARLLAVLGDLAA